MKNVVLVAIQFLSHGVLLGTKAVIIRNELAIAIILGAVKNSSVRGLGY